MDKNAYTFQGVVLPERANLTIPKFSVRGTHLASGTEFEAAVSILLNQVVVRVEDGRQWDILDLRNVVKTIVQNYLAMLGYLTGLAYDLQITRVWNVARGIDYVFGVEMPCITERSTSTDIGADMLKLRAKTTGPLGIYLYRCFGDLVSAMKHADDTGFYCYRAIESLRKHCAERYGLTDAGKAAQWERLRAAAACDEDVLRQIKAAADPLRHGGVSNLSSNNRADLLRRTWDVVDRYLVDV